MKKTVFVDGQHGTTGLKIRERLSGRKDIDVIEIPEDKRKDPAARKKLINAADIVFLCLPDEAARESVGMITAKTRPRYRWVDRSPCRGRLGLWPPRA